VSPSAVFKVRKLEPHPGLDLASYRLGAEKLFDVDLLFEKIPAS